MTTETKQEAQFVSKYAQLRIVLSPSYTKEIHGRVVTEKGSDVQFEGGFYKTDVPEIIEALEARSEFGSIFIRVPNDTKDAVEHRNDMMKSLEDKEKDLADREKAISEKEAELKSEETGKDETNLEDLKRPELIEIAQGLGLPEGTYRVGISNTAVIESIRKARSVPGEGSEGAY